MSHCRCRAVLPSRVRSVRCRRRLRLDHWTKTCVFQVQVRESAEILKINQCPSSHPQGPQYLPSLLCNCKPLNIVASLLLVDCCLCPTLFEPEDKPVWRRMVARQYHKDNCRASPLRLWNPKLDLVAVVIAVSPSETLLSLLQILLSTKNLMRHIGTLSCFLRAGDTEVGQPPLPSTPSIERKVIRQSQDTYRH